MSLLDVVPGPPGWSLDWQGLQDLPWVTAMRGCPQSPVWHAEGDVWIHTRMVLEALIASSAWRVLPEPERAAVFLACLLHDVSKPEVTRTDPDGSITSRGHSRRGAVRARQLLWEDGLPFDLREQICGLVLHHQVPFFAIERADSDRTAITTSQLARPDHLALVAEADARGRICQDGQRLLDNIALWTELCAELGCPRGPYAFDSDHQRVLYVRDRRRDRFTPAYDDTRLTVTLMSGLPGAGKDRWLRTHAPDLPVVSLDDLREELDVDPTEPQGRVVQEARERARAHLRAGQDFAWNATNLSPDLRARTLDLCYDYRARVRIVYVEAPADRLWAQNRGRDRVVPAGVIERLLDRWVVPTRLEAHEIVVVDGAG